MKLNRFIILWGVLDFCSIGWYFAWSVFHKTIPFYDAILASYHTSQSFGIMLPLAMASISAVLYVSFIYSGYLLCMTNPLASKIVYIQTPFRVLTIIPPSLFMITWPLKSGLKETNPSAAISILLGLALLSESLKLLSVIKWKKEISIV